MSSAVIPPGRSGLILGDILGNSAGDTWDEFMLMLPLFLLPRAASSGVFFALGVVAEEPEASRGLCAVAVVAPDLGKTGEGNGWNAEFLPDADSRAGDRTLGDCDFVIKGAKAGF